MKRVFPKAKRKAVSDPVENKRRARFLFSRQEGVRFRADVNAGTAYTGFPDVHENGSTTTTDAAAAAEEEEDESRSNFYSCVLIGINWWHALEKLAPRFPKTFSRKLREHVAKCDPSGLEARFGKHPTRDILPQIEQELDIDLYILIGGKHAPSSISYRPYRASGPLYMRNVYKELNHEHVDDDDAYDDSLGVKRPVVVLQSARPFFHELGNFHTIPHGRLLSRLNSSWTSLWRAIVVERWPDKKNNEQAINEQIDFVKHSLGLAKNEKFQISDGIFNKLRTVHGVNVRLFVGKYVNDNCREKTCYYSTLKTPSDKKVLNILVANYEPDKFEQEFREFSGLSYKRLMEEPWRNPVLAANRQFARRRDIAQNLDDEEIARTLRWTTETLYHKKTDQPMSKKLARVRPNRRLLDSSTSSKDSSVQKTTGLVDSDATHDTVAEQPAIERLARLRQIHKKQNAKIRRKMANKYVNCEADDDDDAGSDGGSESDEMSESDLAFINDGDEYEQYGGGGANDDDVIDRAEQVLNDFDQELNAREGVLSENAAAAAAADNDAEEDDDFDTAAAAELPIRNLGGLVPNVFDSDTLVRVLDPKEVAELPICPTPGCLYTSSRVTYFEKHVKSCSATTTTWIRQSVLGNDIYDFKTELVDEGYLPSAAYATDYNCTFDIECLMSRGPFANEQKEIEAGLCRDSTNKFHNVTTIATLTTDAEKMGFTRQNENYESSLSMIHDFVNYLITIKVRLRQMVPDCIRTGIEVYTNRLYSRLSMDINDGATYASFHELELYRKKLKYLQSFMKLSVYSWFGESYDMQVIYPMLIEAFYRILGEKDLNKVNVIKRGAGYMLLECLGLSFRDFKNYTAPMKLGELAKSCGLATAEFEKGAYCYEWYTSVEQLTRAYNFPAYICFKSSMHIKSGKCAREINEYIFNLSHNVQNNVWHIYNAELRLENRFGNPNLTHLEIFKMASLVNLCDLLKLDNLSDDPALEEFCADPTSEMPPGVVEPIDLTIYYANLLGRLFYFSPERGCLQCDPNNPEIQDFFTFSIKDYVDSWDLWNEIEAYNHARHVEKYAGVETPPPPPKMTMLCFLMNYNFNDVRLLSKSIQVYSARYRDLFNVDIHAELSIAKIAQNIAFSMYDENSPSIYSIPHRADFFYRDCRAKLTGGIVQVFHRAQYMNGADPDLPRSCYSTPNGKTIKCATMYDFASLYPYAVSQFMITGPGILYYPSDSLYQIRQMAKEKERGNGNGIIQISNGDNFEMCGRSTSARFNYGPDDDDSSDDDDDPTCSDDDEILGDPHISVDDNKYFRQKFKNVDFERHSGNISRRFFSYGLFAQRENTTLDSIRYLEYLNWDPARPFQGRIQHSYNLREKRLDRWQVDGYAELDEFIPGSTTIRRKVIIEYNGCAFHYCPWCRRVPKQALKTRVWCPAQKKMIDQELTLEELDKREAARIQGIVTYLRLLDGVEGEHPGDPPTPQHEGPRFFYHIIKFKWACRWAKDLYAMENYGRAFDSASAALNNLPLNRRNLADLTRTRTRPFSKSYPGLFKSAIRPPSYLSGVRGGSGGGGLTADEFKDMVERRDPLNPTESSFHGLALVDLYSPPEVIAAHADIPPIFEKKWLSKREFGGYMADTVVNEPDEIDKLFGERAAENVLCYHASAHLITGEMLDFYQRKGIKYRVHYWVQYYRAKPFAAFVTNLVNQRIKAALAGQTCDVLLFKLIMNAFIGRFALAVARFRNCNITPSSRMEAVLRSPMTRQVKHLRCEDVALDPLHETLSNKKNVTEDLAVQVQIAVYQVFEVQIQAPRDVPKPRQSRG